MFSQLVEKLKEKKFTISSVESLTAGLFCSYIASVPGASSVYKGSLITYASEMKTKLVDVDKEIIEQYGVVSEEVASLMAKGGKEKIETDICVSFTGNAGPSVLDNKKVGEVFIGFAINDKIIVEHEMFSGNRNEIREQVCKFACEKLLELID